MRFSPQKPAFLHPADNVLRSPAGWQQQSPDQQGCLGHLSILPMFPLGNYAKGAQRQKQAQGSSKGMKVIMGSRDNKWRKKLKMISSRTLTSRPQGLFLRWADSAQLPFASQSQGRVCARERLPRPQGRKLMNQKQKEQCKCKDHFCNWAHF